MTIKGNKPMRLVIQYKLVVELVDLKDEEKEELFSIIVLSGNDFDF